MDDYIEKVEIIGLHSTFDIKQEFHPDINIIYGENGQFKTTLLHVLANVLNGDFERFLSLNFNKISIYMHSGLLISLKWRSSARDKLVVSRSDKRKNIAEITRNSDFRYVTENSLPKTAYFPTFRSILEAWFSYSINEDPLSHINVQNDRKEANAFVRKIFGDFIPTINYLSLPEIIEKINAKLFDASSLIAKRDQELMAQMVSDISDILISGKKIDTSKNIPNNIDPELLFDELDSIIERITEYPNHNYLSLPKTIDEKAQAIKLAQGNLDSNTEALILKVINLYKEILEYELLYLEDSFSEFMLYINSLNSFLRNKRIVISSKSNLYFEPFLELKFGVSEAITETKEIESGNSDGLEDKNILSFDQRDSMKGLSSGERQIATLLYAVYISSQEVILIDEPEISLHVAWQRKLLQELGGAIKNKQVIVCTHSPMIGSNFRDSLMSMNISPTNPDEWSDDPEVLDFNGNEESEEEEIDHESKSKNSSSEEELENYKDKGYFEDD